MGHRLTTAASSTRLSQRCERVSAGPTSLHGAFNAIKTLEPKPDNIYLLTDGLPTMGEVMPIARRQGRRASGHLQSRGGSCPSASRQYALFPMEGDPQAAPAYWILAIRTGGSMMAPSEDWP